MNTFPHFKEKCFLLILIKVVVDKYLLDKLVIVEEKLSSPGVEAGSCFFFFHIFTLESQSTAIRDCFLITHGCPEKLEQSLKIWVQSRNNRHCIRIDSVYPSLGLKVCKLLSVCLAFTGSYFTACFSWKREI